MKSEDCANRVLRTILATADGLGYAGKSLTLHLLSDEAGHVIPASHRPYPQYQGQAITRNGDSWTIGQATAVNRLRYEFPRSIMKPGERVVLKFWALAAENGDTVRLGSLPGSGIEVTDNTIPAAMPHDIVITEE